MRLPKFLRCAAFAFCIAGLIVGSSVSAAVLQWEPSSDPDLGGFKIHIGTSSRTYETILDVGLQTSVTLSNLDAGTTYFLAATAYGVNGLESDYSEELQFTPPVDGVTAITLPLSLTVSTDCVFQFETVAGQRCWIVASSDLQIWKQIYSTVPTDSGVMEFLDPSFRTETKRFYRVIATP